MGIEYDISHLSNQQKILITDVYAPIYMRFSLPYRQNTPFDIWLWNVYQHKIFEKLFTPPDEDEPEFPIEPPSETKIKYYDLKKELEALGISTGILTGVAIFIGVIIGALVLYQYSKSYVSEKGAEKARGN